MKQLWAPWRLEYVGDSTSDDGRCIFCIRDQPQQDRKRLVLYRGEWSFVIMNRYPYSNGHVIVAPYRHTADFGELNDKEIVELHRLIDLSRRVLKDSSHPDGFNVGLNLGCHAGAGVPDHIHYHIVPRWNGDTNFMAVLAEVRIIPEHLQETYNRLREGFERLGK